MTKIVNSGIEYIQSKFAAGQPVNIPTVVLANVAGLNPANEVPDNEVIPTNDIVEQLDNVIAGALGPDAVVYSAKFDTTLGDYDFNWMGLLGDGGELVAVEYFPVQRKYKTVGQLVGNNLLRNLVIQFTNAQALTNITVDAQTWQLDFSGRLNASDEMVRLANADLYQAQTFFADGFKVIENTSNLELTAGIGFVQGIRIELMANEVVGVTADQVGKSVYLDVYQELTLTGVLHKADVVFSDVVVSNYVDSVGRQHFLLNIADVIAAGNITDNRDSMSKFKTLLKDTVNTSELVDSITDSSELKRLANADLYQAQTFFADGFKVIENTSNLELTAGVGFVQGIRIELMANAVVGVTADQVGKSVYLDVYQELTLTGVLHKADVVFSDVVVSNYVDSVGRQHFLLNIADVIAAGNITDNRNSIGSNALMDSHVGQLLFTTANQTPPLLGYAGTWEKLPDGVVIQTGTPNLTPTGSNYVTLTESQIPEMSLVNGLTDDPGDHQHDSARRSDTNPPTTGDGSPQYLANNQQLSGLAGAHTHTVSGTVGTLSNSPVDVQGARVTCNVWQRTA